VAVARGHLFQSGAQGLGDDVGVAEVGLCDAGDQSAGRQGDKGILGRLSCSGNGASQRALRRKFHGSQRTSAGLRPGFELVR
jgi:hypothetical protein